MTSGISEFWRKNISPNEPTELANLLRALRKVAGHIGENVGMIEYAGMSLNNLTSIVIDPELVMGQYPVPFTKVDELVGLVTHEALHQTEWSERVWKILSPEFKKMPGLSLVSFQKIIHTGEDIYVDMVADEKIFGLYVRKVRQRIITDFLKNITSPGISVDKLILLWWARRFHPKLISDNEPAYKKPVGILNRLSDELQAVSKIKKGVTARCELRAQLYLNTWHRIRDLISSFPIIDKKLYFYASPATSVLPKKKKKKSSGKCKPPLSLDMVNEIELQLSKNSIDMTSVIQSVVGFDNESIVPTSRWDFSISAHPMIDRRLVSRLKAIFQNYAGRNTIVARGLSSGKIDQRRLYRAHTTGQCFKQKEHLVNLDWNVTLLMDASGSMRGNKWRMVENTVANIHKALSGFHNRLQAFAYFEKDGILMISQLIKNNRIQSVAPSGLTASGQAVIAAAYLMPKGRKRNILIHVTDGESNLGCHVHFGIDYCRKEKIDLITLGCGYQDKDAMIEQYGKSIQFLDHFGQLAKAMERLLKWTFLYDKKPNSIFPQYVPISGRPPDKPENPQADEAGAGL